MSYSICLKCKKAVGWYDKYCPACQIDFRLPDLPNWQKENFTHENFDAWAKREVEKDLKNKNIYDGATPEDIIRMKQEEEEDE